MENYGIKISKPGYAITDADPAHYVFSSKFNTLKVFASGTGSFTANLSLQTATITHGLDYRPAFVVYSEIHAGFGEPSTGKFYMLPHSPPYGIGGSLITDTIIAGVDATYLYVRLGSLVVANTKVINYKYVIFLNPGR